MSTFDFIPWRVLEVRERRLEPVSGHSIYALVDPRDNRVRYIGYTSRELEARLETHLKRPVSPGMARWYRELAPLSLRPLIRLVCVTTATRWERDEMYWIGWCRQLGILLNVDAGGNYRDRFKRVRSEKRRRAEGVERQINDLIDSPDAESTLGTKYAAE